MATGGDIIEVTCSHTRLGHWTFYPKSSEESTYDTGGFRYKDDNIIDGSGRRINTMIQVNGFFECIIANDMYPKQDLEKAVMLAESPVPATWTIHVITGVKYSITGFPVGDLQGDIDRATFKLKVAGDFLEQLDALKRSNQIEDETNRRFTA